MKSILSTKRLSPSQKNLILGAGFSVVEYDAIKIEPLEFEIPKQLENLIFTSKNAVSIYLKKKLQFIEETSDISYFCVGPKTEALLLKNHLKVVKTAQNAEELANLIVEKYKKEHFTFFCGKSRRDELPQLLKKRQVSLEEIEVYQTGLNEKKFEQKFDAVLFFSPSGVQSFTTHNTLKNTLAVCIGSTTANEIQKYTQNYTTANATTIESVIARAVKALL